MEENSYKPDDLDYQILSFMQKDGRVSLTEIASKTNMSVAGIRKRVNKLMEENILQIIGRVEPSRVGFNAYASLQIAVRPVEQLASVIEKISQMPEVSFLATVSGDYDLEINVMCRDNEHFNRLTEQIYAMQGVNHCRSVMYLKVIKWGQPDPDLVRNKLS